MTAPDAILATSASPGDLITEIDTPTGPWYTVLSVDRWHITVDGSPADDDEILPVYLPVRQDDLILRRSRC